MLDRKKPLHLGIEIIELDVVEMEHDILMRDHSIDHNEKRDGDTNQRKVGCEFQGVEIGHQTQGQNDKKDPKFDNPDLFILRIDINAMKGSEYYFKVIKKYCY